MRRLSRWLGHFVLVIIFLGTLTACGIDTPTLGLAPSKQLVQKAIALQVQQTQQQLTQLQASPPSTKITQVTLKQLEPLFLDGLPTYRVLGDYTLKLELPKQVTQQKNSFDVYLQRQQEGKTWRLVLPEDASNRRQTRWRTYLIR